MLCKIGNVDECDFLSKMASKQVVEELKYCINLLDEAYGKERNCYREGGYVIFADTKYDVEEIKKSGVDDLSEWSKEIDGYLIELYLLGDDFSIVLCYPQNLKII